MQEKDLIRYEMEGGMGYNEGSVFPILSKDGEWVEYDKVKSLLDAAIQLCNIDDRIQSTLPSESIDKLKASIKKATEDVSTGI